LPIAGWPEAKKDAAEWGKLTNCGGPPADKPDKWNIMAHLSPPNLGGLLTAAGELNPCAKEIAAGFPGTLTIPEGEPEALEHCSATAAVMCAVDCLAGAHNLPAKMHCGVCCMWKCECGDSPFTDDSPGQGLFDMLTAVAPDPADAGSMAAQLGADAGHLGEQKADWMDRLAEAAMHVAG